METFAPRGKIFGPILPQFILEKPISLGAKVMYALLCNYSSEKDHCWPSQAKLSARLSCSISSVKNYLGELVKANLIDVRQEKYRSSVYYMLLPAGLEVRQPKTAPTPPDIDCPQLKIGYINNLNKESKNTNTPLPPKTVAPKQATFAFAPAAGGVSSFIQDFEELWNLYPKKEAKGFAQNAWLQLCKKGGLPLLSELQNSIKQFMETENWQREQGRFIPHFGNWLRGQRWLDSAIPQKNEDTQTKPIFVDERCKVFLEGEERLRQERQKEREKVRPIFEAFAAKFKGQSFHEPMVFGLWGYLHSKQCAPSAVDVPEDNTLGIIAFLEAHKQKGRAITPAAQALPQSAKTQSTFSVPHNPSSFLSHCGDALNGLGFVPAQFSGQSGLCGARA